MSESVNNSDYIIFTEGTKDKIIAGVDEVARGTFIGPVVAACVVLPKSFPDETYKQIKDSKKLSEKKREFLASYIKDTCITYGVGEVSNEDIDKILTTFDSYVDEKRYSKVVSLDEIRENDYNLNIRRYADTSPPPEIFDVRGILHGGIPVREVEDEYIQETLQGMDVSCVFNRRDSDYYDWKSEIESKEQIRNYLKTDDQKVIAQFERWWDKYRVSLHELDAKVKESEKQMWSYLKELGYE